MSLPYSLTQPLRQGQVSVGAGWRVYFANFNQALAVGSGSTVNGPTIYDLLKFNRFLDSSQNPLPGWWDLGYVDNFKFTPGSKIGNIITGYRGVIRAKYRAEVGEKVTLDFHEVSRMTLKLATGMEIFNILATTAAASTTGPLSSTGTAAVAMGASGYSATGFTGATSGLPTVCVPAGSGALFTAGGMIVCDKDYNGTDYGFVGDSGVTVFQGAVGNNPDFIRLTSDYVSGISKILAGAVGTQDALVLSAPFVGGGNNPLGAAASAPGAGAKVQAITGYAAREGGSTIAQFSAILVMDTEDASQILKYYPRLSIDASPGLTNKALQGATSMQQTNLGASFDAMAFDDPLDGETVVSYTAYFPHPGTSPGV